MSHPPQGADQGAIYGCAPDVGAGDRGDDDGMLNLTPGTRQFIRHYAEMLVAMFGGMLVLGIPAELGLRAIGTSSSELQTDAPAVALLGMAVIMTVPMVAWMRHRGHAWQPSNEMAASMFLPTFGVIALMWGGVIEDFHTLMMLEHVVMLPSMLIAMLLRRDEYSSHAHHATA
jgi:hypothetical protein